MNTAANKSEDHVFVLRTSMAPSGRKSNMKVHFERIVNRYTTQNRVEHQKYYRLSQCERHPAGMFDYLSFVSTV